ncbi:MAG: LytTR family DNA-binding domain-containing protein, partial [Bacteroidota bacterium]
RLQLVTTCANGVEVFNTLKVHAIDLLFLDIQMPQLTGIELLNNLKKPPAVIITTAYHEFALLGYELDVIDYLLKPVSFERCLRAVDKYISRIDVPFSATTSPAVNRNLSLPGAFLYVRSDKKMVRVLLRDLLYIEGLKDYVRIHTADKTLITYQTLTYFEEKLPSEQFIRIHRSFMVSLDHIDAYTALQVEVGEASLPIGQSYARSVLSKLQEK